MKKYVKPSLKELGLLRVVTQQRLSGCGEFTFSAPPPPCVE